jgi:hypothetical protein
MALIWILALSIESPSLSSATTVEADMIFFLLDSEIALLKSAADLPSIGIIESPPLPKTALAAAILADGSFMLAIAPAIFSKI